MSAFKSCLPGPQMFRLGLSSQDPWSWPTLGDLPVPYVPRGGLSSCLPSSPRASFSLRSSELGESLAQLYLFVPRRECCIVRRGVWLWRSAHREIVEKPRNQPSQCLTVRKPCAQNIPI